MDKKKGCSWAKPLGISQIFFGICSQKEYFLAWTVKMKNLEKGQEIAFGRPVSEILPPSLY
jgi:hypothetical protein